MVKVNIHQGKAKEGIFCALNLAYLHLVNRKYASQYHNIFRNILVVACF